MAGDVMRRLNGAVAGQGAYEAQAFDTDVRINQFSLALLHLFKRPLPEVFLESVLRPIGGGRDFCWEGYADAWVEIDGQHVQSVPGGTHWGGGLKISARDQARIGQLLLDGGVHQGRQVVAREWIQRMHEPCAVAPFYGWLTWLNRHGRLFADASRPNWFMFGAGGHMVWIAFGIALYLIFDGGRPNRDWPLMPPRGDDDRRLG